MIHVYLRQESSSYYAFCVSPPKIITQRSPNPFGWKLVKVLLKKLMFCVGKEQCVHSNY